MKRFETWAFNDVLPMTHKMGVYMFSISERHLAYCKGALKRGILTGVCVHGGQAKFPVVVDCPSVLKSAGSRFDEG